MLEERKNSKEYELLKQVLTDVDPSTLRSWIRTYGSAIKVIIAIKRGTDQNST